MATTRKFRFGVAAGAPESAAAWKETAKKAEDLGYSVLLLADHMSRQASPLIAAMAALQVTTTLHLGTQVLANPFRNPVMLAKEIASLDFLSDGRFEPGIGAGWPNSSNTGRSDSNQTGIDMGESGERVEKLIDAVRIIKQFLASSEPFDFEGKHSHLKGVNPFPHRAAGPRAPIMVAGAGPRMMRFAAREADIINIAPRPPIVGPTPAGSMGFGMTMADEIALIKEAAGARYSELEISVFANNPQAQNPSVTDNPDPSIDKLAGDLSTTREAVLAMPATLIGNVETLCERIQMHRELYDVTYRTIPMYAMEQFAPVVARLAGK